MIGLIARPESNIVRLTVHAKPLKGETRLLCEPDGTLTMHVAAPPVKGKANREIVRWLSKKLRRSSSNVQLVAGFHSNVKVIEITGMTEAEIATALDIKCQSVFPARTRR
jgi:uncharacterized protein (TIGR00251 family)